MMPFKQWLGRATLAGVVFLAGCATHKEVPNPKPPPPSSVKVVPPAAAQPLGEEKQAKMLGARVEALSHYSAGLAAEAEGRAEEALQHFYKAGLADPYSEELVDEVAQRLMQALGAYGFLGLRRGKTGFLAHIPHALDLLAAVTGVAGSLPRLHGLALRCRGALEDSSA